METTMRTESAPEVTDAILRDAIECLRRICLALPESAETVTFGHPTFVAGRRTFAVLDEYESEYAIAFKATPADQAALTMDPRFYVSPYSGKHGWTSLRLASPENWTEIDWDEVAALIEASYRLVALKRMIRALDT
jgi:predicted DNA-binding protein (MmcQ/YjbR family)